MKFLNNKKQLLKKLALVCSFLALMAIVAVTGVRFARAEWIEPSQAPANEQLSAPLTTGAENQSKKGYLELNPSYNPTKEYSLTFNPQRPLDVYGTGTRFSTPYTYSDILSVDTDMLYINSFDNWVGVGTASLSAGYKLKVSGGTVQVGSGVNPVSGRAVSTYGTATGAYGDVSSTGTAGVYGVRTASDGIAVRGESSANLGVRGESVTGYGIKATTADPTLGAVYGENTSTGWAGYFDGRLGAGSEAVAQRFVPTWLPYGSLVPFTAGQRVGYYSVSSQGTIPSLEGGIAFDGNSIWVANKLADTNNHHLYKIRSSDGYLQGSYNLPGRYPGDLAFDGKYMWMSSVWLNSSVVKIDTATGSELTSCSTLGSQDNWGADPYHLTVSTINGQAFIWTANLYGGDVTKIDANCNVIGIYPIGIDGTGNDLNRLNGSGVRVEPVDIVAGDGYIWTIIPQMANNLVKINPADGSVAARYATGLTNPFKLIFDGAYIWVITSPTTSENKLVQVRASDGRVVSTYSLPSRVLDLAFDGTNVWMPADANTGNLLRLTIATGTLQVYPAVIGSNYFQGYMLFDGTYLWHENACDATCGSSANKPIKLNKVFSGTGWGRTDLNSVVNLRTQVGACVNPFDPPTSTLAQCLYDWHCPAITGTFGTGGSGIVRYASGGPTKAIEAINIDTYYMYLGGYDRSSDWRLEKRKLFDGTLDAGFGTAGVVTADTTSNQLYSMANDGTYLYAVGIDGNTKWRIEKRRMSTGVLCNTANPCDGTVFGTDGVVTGAATTQNAMSIAVGGSAMLVVGDNSTNDWRIEKRRLSDGALCTAANCGTEFGTGGIVEYSLNPTVRAYSVAIDSGYVYVVGDNWRMEKRRFDTGVLCNIANPCGGNVFGTDGVVDGASINNATNVVISGGNMYVAGDYSRIEKRLTTTGALVPTFGPGGADGDGVITSSNTLIESPAIKLDATSIYMVGRDLNTIDWSIEKRLQTDGSLVPAFGTSGYILGESTSREAFDLALDSTYLYITGSDGNTSSTQYWRIEKRQLTSGALGNAESSEVCSVSNPTQTGNFNVTGSTEIKHGHCSSNLITDYFDRACTIDADCADLVNGSCIGGNIMIGGDVIAPNNQWGGSDETIDVTAGVAACATSGYFIKGVVIDATGSASQVVCRGI